jgi:hypothetical protein
LFGEPCQPHRSAQDQESGDAGGNEDLEMFARMQAEAAQRGGWGDAFPFSRGTIHVTLEELMAFFEDYIALLKRYQREPDDMPADARLVLTRFFAYPAPSEGGAVNRQTPPA